ncbi:LysR family transcriptional regulator [Paludibacterium yongneupense]|uniref:LysR family transcriptional regulator n=1 Tax=Paludibacterium yongneupense TaxID=400061 RepID=UPI0004121BD5|nr:LysR family transcriptional regulator [Paludibacterium yongneupense]
MTLRFSLRELAVFTAIADAGGVTRAADTLSMTQSAASQALAVLEQALETTLFDRAGRRLLLNEQGRLLLPRAHALLEQAADIQSLFDGVAASLRLGASTTIANYLLPECMARFAGRHPGARVELEVGNTRDIVAAVAAFRVDIGFIEGPCHQPGLQLSPWRDDALVIFAGRGHPLSCRPASLAELAAAAWILREVGSGTREVVEQGLLPWLGSLNLTMELGNSEAIKRSVAAGLGVSCLSRSVVAELLASGELCELDVVGLPPLRRTLYRVMRGEKALTRSLRAFLDETRPQYGA